MPNLRTLLFPLAALALTSCESTARLPAPIRAVNPPANLVAECDGPATLESDSLGDIGDVAVMNAIIIRDCQLRHRLLVEWILGK